jgi:hypothetical protein
MCPNEAARSLAAVQGTRLPLFSPRSTATVAVLVTVMALAATMAFHARGGPLRRAVEPLPAPVAWVEVGGDRYAFSPKTCVVVDDAFVVSGLGEHDGEPFVASFSKPGGIEVAFGVTSDTERPDADEPWWVSSQVSRYQVTGDTVRASALVEDRSGQVPGVQPVQAQATCPGAS